MGDRILFLDTWSMGEDSQGVPHTAQQQSRPDLKHSAAVQNETLVKNDARKQKAAISEDCEIADVKYKRISVPRFSYFHFNFSDFLCKIAKFLVTTFN